MAHHTDRIRSALAAGVMPAGALCAALNVSRPTLARALSSMPGEIVTLGAARATRYALRDRSRGLVDLPVYRVDAAGQISPLGQLVPVRPDGFAMLHADGETAYYEGLPWWLADARPQGFLGRAYAHRHALALGLPTDVRHWSDADALRALVLNGGDTPGNLLLGDRARDRFVNAPNPQAVSAAAYPQLAAQALTIGETWSSAGGEQPKFCAYTDAGHVLVKFTAPDDNPVSARWRDLLLTEHLALETLRTAEVHAAVSRVVDTGSQRFLALQRFDRIGLHGRRALVSLGSLDGEFVGNAAAPWPVITASLAKARVITVEADASARLLFAFGSLIGNTDMHFGNLSFVGDGGTPYSLSPAYDMLPMAFSPTAGGALRDMLGPAYLHPAVDALTWRRAHSLACEYLIRIRLEPRLQATFTPCIHALQMHLDEASERMRRLG